MLWTEIMNKMIPRENKVRGPPYAFYLNVFTISITIVSADGSLTQCALIANIINQTMMK